MNAPFALSIYLMRSPDGSIVICDERVEELAQDAAYRIVRNIPDRIADGTLPKKTRIPTVEETLIRTRADERRRAEQELSYVAEPWVPMPASVAESLMSGRWTRD